MSESLQKDSTAPDPPPEHISSPFTTPRSVPAICWVIWFGPWMQGARLRAFHALRANIGVEVKLVTEENLHLYNVSTHPFHRAIEQGMGLSQIHRGDYLRAYLMHHYGGGYHDVKPHSSSWKPWFKRFDFNDDLWLLGVKEPSQGGVGCDESYAALVLNATVYARGASSMLGEAGTNGYQGECCKRVKESWKSLVSNGAYIMRPHTPLTREWLLLLEKHLDAKLERATLHPAPYSRCCNGKQDAKGYPFRWAELHGEAFHPLQFVYRKHIAGGLPRWDAGNYKNPATESVARTQR